MEKREAGILLCDFLSGRKIPEARLEKLSPADKENLVDWALRFKVGGLFYREIKLRKFQTEFFPVEARNRLRKEYRDLATMNTSFLFDVLKVLKSLADNQLPVIALKGLSLAMDIYGDIAGLLKTSSDKIDWHIVIERAARWGGHKCVYLMLLLVQELLGVSPPDNILSEIRPDDYQSVFFDIALKQIFDENSSDPQIIKRIGYFSTIKKAKGFHGKIMAMAKKVFLSKEHMAHIYYPVPVSSPKIYLCYLFRLGHMINYFAHVLLRLFRRDQSVIKAVHQEHRVSVVYDWMYS